MLHIQREQFTPRRAKFYAAEVLLALEYFHKMGIVYRLALVLFLSLRCKVTDFFKSRSVISNSTTSCSLSMDTSKWQIMVCVKKICGSRKPLRLSAVLPSSWLPR